MSKCKGFFGLVFFFFWKNQLALGLKMSKCFNEEESRFFSLNIPFWRAPWVSAALLGLVFRVSPFLSCRFTKNLSPDKINLSTLKGQGQLTNLELDEEVLQNVLELPTWLAITRVYCNKASIRVSRGGCDGVPGFDPHPSFNSPFTSYPEHIQAESLTAQLRACFCSYQACMY